jgi:RNA polymerase sigma-70 factor (ECF subfamily)
MTRNNRLSQWVESYASELYSWAFHKVSDSELAKDIVQDTFLAAAEKIDGFKGDSEPKTLLFSILDHKIIDHYRRKINQSVSIENQSLSEFFDEDGAVTFIIYDQTDDQTTEKTAKDFKAAGLEHAIEKHNGAGMVSFFNICAIAEATCKNELCI